MLEDSVIAEKAGLTKKLEIVSRKEFDGLDKLGVMGFICFKSKENV
ncbi:hypothetical protein [Geoglobus acetivorans]|uniref:Uncharacterized protein n=1 Tax=Geoglobus acetivorans TaxID=565033 RepID=A0ABZ3GZV6_GEOAI|nr:hypothetical protein [Geoglobus acetivorans]